MLKSGCLRLCDDTSSRDYLYSILELEYRFLQDRCHAENEAGACLPVKQLARAPPLFCLVRALLLPPPRTEHHSDSNTQVQGMFVTVRCFVAIGSGTRESGSCCIHCVKKKGNNQSLS